jgi:large subunit ribosomal protein L15
VRLHELQLVEGDTVDLAALKAAGVIKQGTRYARIMASGEIGKAVTVRGIAVTKGARAAIEAAGGKVEE